MIINYLKENELNMDKEIKIETLRQNLKQCKYKLEIRTKDYWKDLSFEERREYEDNGTFEYEGHLFYEYRPNKFVKTECYIEGGSEHYIEQEIRDWLKNCLNEEIISYK